MLHEVAKSPTIQNRLHTELVSVLGDGHRQVTAEDITKLSFAKNCIREILRCVFQNRINNAVASGLQMVYCNQSFDFSIRTVESHVNSDGVQHVRILLSNIL